MRRGPNPKETKKILDKYNIYTCARSTKMDPVEPTKKYVKINKNAKLKGDDSNKSLSQLDLGSL